MKPAQTRINREKIFAGALAALGVLFHLNASAAPALVLQKDDHIALVGNALADRMQHFGHLETLIYAKHPQLDLVFRNLAVPGDEVAGFEADPNNKKDQRNNFCQRSGLKGRHSNDRRTYCLDETMKTLDKYTK